MSPSAAITEGFKLVEAELRAAGREFGLDPTGRTPVARLVQDLVRAGAITPESAQAIGALRDLRNVAAHSPEADITADRALEFIDLTQAVLYVLRRRPDQDGGALEIH